MTDPTRKEDPEAGPARGPAPPPSGVPEALKELEWLNALIKAVSVSQAQTMVQHFILRDLVIQIAKAQKSPDGYVAEMFERVSRLVDQCDLAGKPDIEAEMRWYTESFFTLAGNTASKT